MTRLAYDTDLSDAQWELLRRIPQTKWVDPKLHKSWGKMAVGVFAMISVVNCPRNVWGCCCYK
jgi:hypothetical protein